jgi:hypothetical protein
MFHVKQISFSRKGFSLVSKNPLFFLYDIYSRRLHDTDSPEPGEGGADFPRIAPLEGFFLRVTWEQGRESIINIEPHIRAFKALAPLRSPEEFRQARVGEWGWHLEWPGGADIPTPARRKEKRTRPCSATAGYSHARAGVAIPASTQGKRIKDGFLYAGVPTP